MTVSYIYKIIVYPESECDCSLGKFRIISTACHLKVQCNAGGGGGVGSESDFSHNTEGNNLDWSEHRSLLTVCPSEVTLDACTPITKYME